MKIPYISIEEFKRRTRDTRVVELERKAKKLARYSKLPVWFVNNILRWRIARGLPVFALATSKRTIMVPCRLYRPSSSGRSVATGH